MNRVHIVGCPRSGTTLMMELLVTCFASDGYCPHERSLFEEPECSGATYFTKQPSDIKYIEEVLRKDPRLFVIFMIRDPRAVVSSVHDAHANVYFCNFRVWRECADHARRLIDHPRFLQVRYETLIQDPDGVQEQIGTRFPFLVKKHPFSSYETIARPSPESLKAMSGLRPISPERITGWHAHLPRIKEQVEAYPGFTRSLIEYGYESDDSWLAMLEQVEAVKFPCRYPDNEPFLKRLETRLRKRLQARRYLARRGLV